MKKTGIISAMWVEAEKLHKAMEPDTVEEYEYNGMKFYEGKLCGCDVVLSTCGIGKINAAVYTQLMIDKFGPDEIIHTGIAGSLDPEVKHLDVVIADGLTYHDVRKSQLTELFPFREIFPTDSALTESLAANAGEKSVRKGLILTGDLFVTDALSKAKLKERFQEALCVEMESCAVAHTAFVNGIPIAVVRCISDLADGAAHEDYDEFEKKASDTAAEIVMRTLKKMGENRG